MRKIIRQMLMDEIKKPKTRFIEDTKHLTNRQAALKYWSKQEAKRAAEKIFQKQKEQKNSDKINQVLINFYKESETEDRLSLLKKISTVEIERLDKIQLLNVRKDFNKVKDLKFSLIGKKCWVCNNEAKERHHVILLKNGGPALSEDNIVYLCNICHALIHPWMITELLRDNTSQLIHILQEVADGSYSRFEAKQKMNEVLDDLLDKIIR